MTANADEPETPNSPIVKSISIAAARLNYSLRLIASIGFDCDTGGVNPVAFCEFAEI